MFRRAIALLALGSVLGVFFATFFGPHPAGAEEAPAELRAEPPAPTPEAKALSRPIIEATRRVRPAVVQIVGFRTSSWTRQLRQSKSGSGFIISRQGHVLTNRHVVKETDKLIVQLNDGRVFERIRILGTDPRSDVAILRIEGVGEQGLPVATMGDSDSLEVGEMVLAIGAPYGLESSVSLGVVSATGRADLLGRDSAEDFIQTDAALNAGNSGGPLVNLAGQVVGINTAIQGATGANVGIGFSIPINLARSIALALVERGEARRGFLGVRGSFLPGALLSREGIRAKGGLRIGSVVEASPAARAGLRKNDVITEVNGRPLRRLQVLWARLTQAGPGGELELRVHRGDRDRLVKVTLGEERLRTYGIQVADLTPARARELGLDPRTPGVLVTGIEKGSVAAAAGAENRLLPGDVIWRIDFPGGSRYVRSREDFEKLMKLFRANPPREIHFIIRTRDGDFRVRLYPSRES